MKAVGYRWNKHKIGQEIMRSKVICVIMGGGRGTRLHPLTKLRCKPAVPLAGKYRLVDIPISNCLNSGLNRIYVLSQFNTASLHHHIQESYKFDPFGGGSVDILSAEQTERGEAWYQGTADAVRQNLHHLHVEKEDLVLILSGDQLYSMDFRQVLEQHKRTGADVTIAGTAMDKREVAGFGLMRIQDDLAISQFVEKPKDPKVIDSLVIPENLRATFAAQPGTEYCLVNMGIYVFRGEVLIRALDNASTDFGREIIPSLLGRVKLLSYIYTGYWEDIGTIGAFFEANLRLTDLVPPFNFFDQDYRIYTRARYLPAAKINGLVAEGVIMGDGAIVTQSTLKRCVVGVRGVVGEGSQLENVVVMGNDYYESEADLEENRQAGVPPLGIGKNCRIRNAIIDKNCRIGDNVVLDPAGKPDLWEAPGIMVRDKVLVVIKEAVIPNGTVVAP